MREEFVDMYRGINMLSANGIIDRTQERNMKEALLMSVIDYLMEMNANEDRRQNSVLDRKGNDQEGVRTDNQGNLDRESEG